MLENELSSTNEHADNLQKNQNETFDNTGLSTLLGEHITEWDDYR